MTLEQLRIFLETARLQHVTKAASVLNLTQSAVSASIAALEERHDVRLFDRIGRRIELTEAGRLFVPEARALLSRADAAALMLAELGGAPAGTIRLHASQTVASYWLPARLVRFRALYPRVTVQLTVGNTTTVAEAVLNGAADLGVVEGEVAEKGLARHVVAEDHLLLVVSPGHAWAKRSEITAEELPASRWVMREPGSGTRAAFESALHARSLSLEALDVILELPSNEAVCVALETAECAGILSERAVEPHLSRGRLVAVPFAIAPRSFLSLHHAGRQQTRAAEALKAILRGEPVREG